MCIDYNMRKGSDGRLVLGLLFRVVLDEECVEGTDPFIYAGFKNFFYFFYSKSIAM